MPAGALGLGAPTIKVLDPVTGVECPPARFDEHGQLLNPDEAIGEIVNTGPSTFEGYWRNEEAERERLRDGAYWTGDLAYRDDAGYFYFAGRSADWLRVDGENFAAGPIERILLRHPDVQLAAVFGVPDPLAGDQVMAALLLVPGATFDPEGFERFLAEQADLGPKWSPSFVRIAPELPLTPTNKVLKRALVAERWRTDDPVWWRSGRDRPFLPLTDDDRAALAARFAEHGRTHVLDQ
jgi:fatty-acyl-CoA synthase